MQDVDELVKRNAIIHINNLLFCTYIMIMNTIVVNNYNYDVCIYIIHCQFNVKRFLIWGN